MIPTTNNQAFINVALDASNPSFISIALHCKQSSLHRGLQNSIAPYLLRLHDMGRAVQGGITARRDEPEPESDGYDASLEAMFD